MHSAKKYKYHNYLCRVPRIGLSMPTTSNENATRMEYTVYGIINAYHGLVLVTLW